MSNSALSVYYYFLSISYWDSERREDHYYVPKKKVNKSAIARELGLGRTSVYNGISELLEKRKLTEDDNYYYLPHPRFYTYIDQSVLTYLISFFPIFGSDVIRICAVVHEWIRNYPKEGLNETDLIGFLDIQDASCRPHHYIRALLPFLKEEGFIEYYKQRETHGAFTYDVYYFTATHLSALPASCVITENGHANAQHITETKKRVDNPNGEEE